MNFNVENEDRPSGLAAYVSRNAAWIQPAAATLLAVATPAMLASVDSTKAAILPAWLVSAAGALGCFATGLGAARTDTTSASVVRLLGFVVAVVIVVAAVLR